MTQVFEFKHGILVRTVLFRELFHFAPDFSIVAFTVHSET